MLRFLKIRLDKLLWDFKKPYQNLVPLLLLQNQRKPMSESAKKPIFPPLLCARSNRLKGISAPKFKGAICLFEDGDGKEDGGMRPANAPRLRVRNGLVSELSPEAKARPCTSKGRGSLYDPIYGIYCHLCSAKKLCGEEDCKRCGNLDMNELCIGKTDCSVCHSSTGVFCRACLMVRYGEAQSF